MCGRFVRTSTPRQLAEHFGLSEVPELFPHYNVAPTQPVVAVRLAGAGQRELVWLRWGLIPPWARDQSSSFINARAETAASKPAFRHAFRKRRCLVPADAFYEWQKVDGRKQPYLFRLKDDGPFAFAGLWERWQLPEGEPVETCAVLTTDANELVRPVHDRMPVILAPGDYAVWLDADASDVEELLRPYPAEDMAAVPVSTLVNNPTHDTPECLRPVA